MTEFKELTTPDDADDIKFAREVCRVFVGGGDSFVVLDEAIFAKNLSHWGYVLADIAGHVANAIALSEGISKEAVFREIELGYSERVAAAMNIKGRILGARQ